MGKKIKEFESKMTDTVIKASYYGDEGIYIQLYDMIGGEKINHIFKDEDEVKRFIFELVKLL